MTDFKVPKMTREDDVEAFLEASERVVVAVGLEKVKWANKLAVQGGAGSGSKVGQALAAYQAMSRVEAQGYDKEKREILYWLASTLEQYCQLFQMKKRREDKMPKVLLQNLADLLDKWLKPMLASKAEICLEQFLADLEETTKSWVLCHQPKTLAEALRLAKHFDSAQADP